jgi:heme-degrading monooxygenase HmoA
VTWLEGSPEQAREAIEAVRTLALPAIAGAPGFGELLLLIDRDHGRALTITTWEAREDLDASEELARRLRALPLARWTTAGTERFEVVLRRTGAQAGVAAGSTD